MLPNRLYKNLSVLFCISVLLPIISCERKYVEIVHTVKLQHLNLPSQEDMQSVCFINSTTGFVAGADGQIFHTIDGGSEWTNISLANNVIVNKVWFLTATNGFAGTENGIYRTVNGGSTWESVQDLVTVNDMFFCDSNIGYAVGGQSGSSDGYIYKTTNNGLTWTKLYTNGLRVINGVSFINKDTGYVCTNEQFIYVTTNGGNSWEYFYSSNSSTQNFSELFFTGDLKGYAVGSKGFIHPDFDSDISKLRDYEYDLNAIDIHNGKMVVVGENSIIIPAVNDQGSLQWQNYLAPDGTTIAKIYNDVEFADETTFYAVGNGGTVTKFTYPQ